MATAQWPKISSSCRKGMAEREWAGAVSGPALELDLRTYCAVVAGQWWCPGLWLQLAKGGQAGARLFPGSCFG
jgi:hypothetical protein